MMYLKLVILSQTWSELINADNESNKQTGL